ncbi:hypothetical protein ACIA5D_28025 [Actinoplanes sp. NPDC051513]|uniref:hypothetical protein n=1 Tax=Actinoplanes sp. NPDC051513 TaxID=3363908 RepID=UPI0037BDB4C8
MMRRTLAWIAAVTAALLVGLPGVARAVTTWNPASCATGSFGPVTVDAQGHYLVPAHMALCEPYQARFNYAIALFHPDGTVPIVTGDKLQAYSATGPANVIADVRPAIPDPVFAFCLMRDVNTRVACVRVDTAPDGAATSTPIAVDDYLVADPVVYLRKQVVLIPNYCATCVTLTW